MRMSVVDESEFAIRVPDTSISPPLSRTRDELHHRISLLYGLCISSLCGSRSRVDDEELDAPILGPSTSLANASSLNGDGDNEGEDEGDDNEDNEDKDEGDEGDGDRDGGEDEGGKADGNSEDSEDSRGNAMATNFSSLRNPPGTILPSVQYSPARIYL
jgi:hypothetical protein